MTKKILFLFFLGLNSFLYSQSIYKSATGKISFFSEAPIENIEAHNEDVKAIMNLTTKEIALIVPIISFRFEKPLMEEHFNENYMESDKYKTAQFKGKIKGNFDTRKNGTYQVTGVGILNIHGVEQEREIDGVFIVNEKTINLICTFPVNLKDHKIDIPKIVIKNIAENVDVKVDLIFEPK